MQYNTAHPTMIIPEYGRHVQKMAEYLLTIKNRQERNKATEVVIQTMAQVHPYAKDGEDLRRKLWDHLHIITAYKLDVDGPYPKPSPDLLESKPKRLQYPAYTGNYRHYGKIISEMIKKAVKYKEGEERDALVENIAMNMKKAYMTWNKSTVDDRIIVNDLKSMSQGKLELKDLAKLSNVSVSIAPPQRQNNNYGRSGGKRNKKDRNRRKKNRNGGF